MASILLLWTRIYLFPTELYTMLKLKSLPLVFLVPLVSLSATNLKASTRDDHRSLSPTKENCPSTLTCYTVKMPLNHQDPKSKTIPVAFAVHPAKSERKGALLLVFGGPGDSGISGLRDWLPTLDKKLLDAYDVVSFDLRGIHRSGNLNCPIAYGDFSFVPTMAGTPEERAALKAGAEKFAKDCPKEMGLSKADLPHYNTTQAIQDINMFRSLMGYSSFTVHAMSYGTQFIQHYATRYPTQMDAIVLDGAVDMKADLLRYETDLADAQNDVLDQSFKACERDAKCSTLFANSIDGETDIGKIYDRVRDALREGPASVEVKGEFLNFGLFDFEYAVAGSIGRPEARSDLMKALSRAAGPDEDYSLLMKIANGEPLKDEPVKKAETPKDKSFTGMSNGIFYAFICNDYGMTETRPNQRINAFFGNARDRESSLRIRNALYGETPCAFWSSTGSSAGKNQTQIAANIPVVVVNSTADANVPAKHGYAVAASLENVSLIDVIGGKHIMYGYKNACIDNPVTEFLLSHRLPSEGRIECLEKVIAPLKD